MATLTLTRPDDMHLHLRDGAALTSVVADSARQFARAVVMPNLAPPVLTLDQARDYRRRILEALPRGSDFEPLMTLYLTDVTAPEAAADAATSGEIHAIKYYPAGATTHAEAGVTAIDKVYPVLERMAETGLPLLLHGEATDPGVDTFDREAVFIDTVLEPLLQRFPGLKLVLEHITTREAVDCVMAGPDTLAATITPQHLLYNRNQLFRGGLRPHHFCLPVLKREAHRRAVLEAAISGHPRFFLGTDSAPHARHAKEAAHGCAGIYSAPLALELYAEVFAAAGALDRLEAFASFHGADFYGLARNTGTVTLAEEEWTVPDSLPFADSEVVPLRAGETCRWRMLAA